MPGHDQPARVKRKLAAILSADVRGYSRLMEADEEGTLRTLTAYRETMAALVAARDGRVVGTAGDSLLAEFPSSVEAVTCGLEIQAELARRNAALPEERRLEFRIGINAGDVIVQGNDLFGDGVNIAARIQALAEAGTVYVSGSVYDEIRQKLPIVCESRGSQRVKNIADPVRVYRVRDAVARPAPVRAALRPSWPLGLALGLTIAVIALIAWHFYERYALMPDHRERPGSGPGATAVAPAPDRPSIAVLAFTNLSGDPEQDYFGDGISEDLITDLAKLSGLKVIARNSAFAYKGQAVNLVQVGRDLGARYVLEGSVRKMGERVRITAQLVDAATGQHLWAERYDRPLQAIFDLQDEVRQKIIAALAIQLTPGEREQLSVKLTNNVEAYDYWTRALELMQNVTPESFQRARDVLLRAIAADPAFARAYAQVANTYALEMAQTGFPLDAGELDRALEYALKAIALDARAPQVHLALGRLSTWRGEHDRAIAAMETALALDPNYADAYAFFAQVLTYAGRAADALAAAERAVRMNAPAPFWYLHFHGFAQFHLGRYDAAAELFKQALDKNLNWQISRRYLIAAFGHLGRREDAAWQIAESQALGYAETLTDAKRYLLPYRDPRYREHLLEGLRKAGLPQ